MRSASAALNIDPAILSKIENGKRKARRDLVERMEIIYDQEHGSLVRLWLSDRILDEIKGEQDPWAVLQVAEEAIAYQKAISPEPAPSLSQFNQVFNNYPAICRAWVFGSYARGDQGMKSDLDIMLEVKENDRITIFDLAEIQERLNRLTGRKVDVVLSRSLRPEFLARVEKERSLIYEAK